MSLLARAPQDSRRDRLSQSVDSNSQARSVAINYHDHRDDAMLRDEMPPAGCAIAKRYVSIPLIADDHVLQPSIRGSFSLCPILSRQLRSPRFELANSNFPSGAQPSLGNAYINSLWVCDGWSVKTMLKKPRSLLWVSFFYGTERFIKFVIPTQILYILISDINHLTSKTRLLTIPLEINARRY